ncbi:MAG: hypothetical protein QW117_00820 [Candidatus Pacearchaeota archaeon]
MKIKIIGIILIIIGVIFQFLNIINYSLWNLDIDLIGFFIFILGIIILLTNKRKLKNKSKKGGKKK